MTAAYNLKGRNMELLNLNQVCGRLKLSRRSVYRLKDAGRMPQPLRLGRALRWRADELDQWVANGCKPCDPRRAGGRVAR